jgi:hypothetical protein
MTLVSGKSARYLQSALTRLHILPFIVVCLRSAQRILPQSLPYAQHYAHTPFHIWRNTAIVRC